MTMLFDEKTYASYPSLYAMGHKAIRDIFLDPVVIEEKVDGSQFSFGVTNGVLQCRSKRCVLDLDHPEKLFSGAVWTAKRLFMEGKLAEGWVYRGEAIQSPKHNTLCYDRTPHGNIALFDIMVGLEDYMSYGDKATEAASLCLEVVPALFIGTVSDLENLKSLMETVSFLGGQKIEGFVVKNYARFGYDKKPLMGKYVSEAFKEIHSGDWKERAPKGQDICDRLTHRYRTPARWQKAVQHLAEEGKLTETPADIGPLIREVQADVLRECSDEMKDTLLKWAWEKVGRAVVGGLPQWYKERLLETQVMAPATETPAA